MENEETRIQDKLWLFQLYLLSVMRVQSSVLRAALQQLQATEHDLQSAKEAMIALGFNVAGVKVELYHKVLGEPFAIQHIDASSIPATFHGSRSLRFRLPLWPDFDFVVNEDPNGYAWNAAFRRSQTELQPLLDSIVDLKTWKFTKEDVTNRFGMPEHGDGWDCWEELYYMMPLTVGGQNRRCFLLFDYNLLQSFEICD
jgi:hypothetical protein